MDEQSQNAHDELTDQASRLPNPGSASAYPCAEDIIARFVEFGKVRNCLPPPRGKVPPQGADEGGSRGCGVLSRKSLSFVTASPRHLPPRVGKAKENPPAGDWGLTFFHIMLY